MMKIRLSAVAVLLLLLSTVGAVSAGEKFSLTTIDGKVLDSAALRGTVIVLIVGSDW